MEKHKHSISAFENVLKTNIISRANDKLKIRISSVVGREFPFRKSESRVRTENRNNMFMAQTLSNVGCFEC